MLRRVKVHRNHRQGYLMWVIQRHSEKILLMAFTYACESVGDVNIFSMDESVAVNIRLPLLPRTMHLRGVVLSMKCCKIIDIRAI